MQVMLLGGTNGSHGLAYSQRLSNIAPGKTPTWTIEYMQVQGHFYCQPFFAWLQFAPYPAVAVCSFACFFFSECCDICLVPGHACQ